MRNPDLARDYVRRASVRLRALDVLFEGESWADVLRESQEIVDSTGGEPKVVTDLDHVVDRFPHEFRDPRIVESGDVALTSRGFER